MLPDGWKLSMIEDMASVSSGGTPSRDNQAYWGGDIPWVTTSEIKKGVIFDTEQKITKEGLSNSSAKLYPIDTLLMAMYGQGKTRGQVAKLGIDASTNQACAAIIFNELCDVDYYHYFLQSRYDFIRNMANAGGQENLSAGIIKGIQIPVPPLPEQKKIAQILSTWDNAISDTERLLENSQQRKKALMQQLLTGKKRLPGFEGEWRKLSLGSLFKRVLTRNNGQSDNVVTISGQHGLISQKEFFKKSVASEILDGYYLLVKGQFAYNKSYSNGYPMGAIKRLNRYENGVVTTLYICFELIDESNVCGDFFEQYFESGILNRGISQIAHEGGRANGLLNVKPSDFFSLRIFIPELEEQQTIAKVLTTADQEIVALQKRLDHLKQEKKALMQQLLTGKRRVQVEEVA